MKNVFFLLLVGFFLYACSQSQEEELKEKKAKIEAKSKDEKGIIQGKSLAKYVGKPGRLIVVCDKTVFTEELFQALDTTFGEFIRPYYPPFQKFEVIQIDKDRFDKGLRRTRNVLLIELTEDVPAGKPEMRIKKDYYAKHQLLTEIKANTMNDLMNLIVKEIPGLVKLYEELEWKREYYRHKKANNKVIKKRLVKDFGITLELPKKGRYEYNKKDYAHIIFPERSRQMDIETNNESDYSTSKANFIQSGIMIWETPFKDSFQLHPEYLLQVRDTILKYNAKHQFPGVYMGTQDHPAVLPVYKRLKIGEVEGYEFKGLFKFTGRLEPSGGKFWSFHFYHPKRNSIIAVSGYLDAPPTMNPALDLRRIQAVLYSIKLED